MMSDQERNLRLLGRLAFFVPLVLAAVVVLLYQGHEAPPYHLRFGPTSASGYAAPPTRRADVGADRSAPLPVAVPGTVPRTAAPGASRRVPGGGEEYPAPQQPGVGREAPLAGSEATMSGADLYRINCSMCHGMPGEGIGPVGERYIPRPPDLAESLPRLSDAELYAVITDGVRSTPTPEAARYLPDRWHAFRPLLGERERRAVVSYLRGGSGLWALGSRQEGRLAAARATRLPPPPAAESPEPRAQRGRRSRP